VEKAYSGRGEYAFTARWCRGVGASVAQGFLNYAKVLGSTGQWEDNMQNEPWAFNYSLSVFPASHRTDRGGPHDREREQGRAELRAAGVLFGLAGGERRRTGGGRHGTKRSASYGDSIGGGRVACGGRSGAGDERERRGCSGGWCERGFELACTRPEGAKVSRGLQDAYHASCGVWSGLCCSGDDEAMAAARVRRGGDAGLHAWENEQLYDDLQYWEMVKPNGIEQKLTVERGGGEGQIWPELKGMTVPACYGLVLVSLVGGSVSPHRGDGGGATARSELDGGGRNGVVTTAVALWSSFGAQWPMVAFPAMGCTK